MKTSILAIVCSLCCVANIFAQSDFYERNLKIVQDTYAALNAQLKQPQHNLKAVKSFYEVLIPLQHKLQETDGILRNYQYLATEYLQKNIPDDFKKYKEDYLKKDLPKKQKEWQKQFGKGLDYKAWEKAFHAKNVAQVYDRLVKFDAALLEMVKQNFSYANFEKMQEIQAQTMTLDEYLKRFGALQKKITEPQIEEIMANIELHIKELENKH